VVSSRRRGVRATVLPHPSKRHRFACGDRRQRRDLEASEARRHQPDSEQRDECECREAPPSLPDAPVVDGRGNPPSEHEAQNDLVDAWHGRSLLHFLNGGLSQLTHRLD